MTSRTGAVRCIPRTSTNSAASMRNCTINNRPGEGARVASFRASVDRHLEAFLSDLRTFVELESPTVDKAACDRAGQQLAQWYRQYTGAEITWHRQERWGDHFEARVGRGPRKVLVLGHFDTVWPIGTIERLPCRIDAGRLTGPGSFDMKYGDIQALWGLRFVVEAGAAADKTVTVL